MPPPGIGRDGMDDETKQAILYDSAYIAGLKAGYNLGLYEDHETLASHINRRLKDRAEIRLVADNPIDNR